MSGLPILALGFLTGLRHALDTDHLAAVASLAAGVGRARPLGAAAAWGVGHAGILMLAAILSGWTGAMLPPGAQAGTELAAGLVVVWLGIDLLRRTRSHAHRPPDTVAWHRSLAVGGVHGVSGSAVVGLLAVQGMPLWECVAYAAIFGAGTIAGMLALTAALSVSFGRAAPAGLGRLQLAVGVVAATTGAWLVWTAGGSLLQGS